MCLPVSRLFWVSSLAYPNLLGTKGYVVVVVVMRPRCQSVAWRLPSAFGTLCLIVYVGMPVNLGEAGRLRFTTLCFLFMHIAA
jgi:hypothetical protein